MNLPAERIMASHSRRTSVAESNRSVPALFAQVAAGYADRIAISATDRDWTYAELDQRSQALAGQILDRMGEGAEPVALLMEHGAPLIAAILGVLKAGKIYLALDSNHPVQRLAAMCADSGARLVIADETNSALARSLGSGFDILEADGSLAASTRLTLPEISAESGAWLMYTSGSAGEPKGVWQNHRSVVHHAQVYGELIELGKEDRLTLLTSFSLAASATALFAALLHGATLCPFHLRSQGIGRLSLWMRERRITVYHSVPTVFRHLSRLASAPQAFEHTRLVRLGGEAVSPGDVQLFRDRGVDDCRLMHAFSSTETGLVSALILDKQTPIPESRVSAGRPVRDVQLTLLNERGEPVDAGSEGTIAVRGAFLSQGYWKRPDLTAEKFLPDPDDLQVRTFVTSDLGRLLPDGSLEHLGRRDRVTKIRGQRVDLGEVESALQSTNLFAETAAIATEVAGENRLIAYVVPRAKSGVSSQSCRQSMQGLVPEHMIPSEFVSLEKLPQTPGGKIDRRALPAAPDSQRTTESGVSPRKGLERILAEFWQSVLRVPSVGRHDNFFDLGGTSLESARILAFIHENYNVLLAPSVLMEHGTIEQLALLVGNRVMEMSSGPSIVLREAAAGRPLFLIHGGEGNVGVYGQLVRRLPERPIYGLQSIGLNGDEAPLITVPAMVRRYLSEVLARDPTGPYLLGGVRMGALVALEMARQLRDQGRPVGLVALFDFVPVTKRTLRPIAMATHARDRIRILRWSIIRILRRKQKLRWLPAYRSFISKMNCHTRHDQRPVFYPGTITLFLTDDRKSPRAHSPASLSRYARETRFVAIPGKQFDLFRSPAVNELAAQLQLAIETAEAGAATSAR